MRNTFRFCSIFLVFFSINTLLLAQNINNNLDKLFETEFNVGDNFETFCPDGILRRNGLEDKLWKNSSIRLCFLLKDCNGSEDARNYSDANNMFGYRLGAWTYGIFAIYTNKESVGRYPEIYERKNAFRKCPIAIVNNI